MAADQQPAGSVVLRDRAGWPEAGGAPEPDAVLEIRADYEAVRTQDPERARAWRLTVRTVLTAAYEAGLQVGSVGDHGYRLVVDQEEER